MATLWDRTKAAFERTLDESRKATDRLVESLGEAGETARARIERARLERSLFKQFAELGSRVYEHASGPSAGDVLEDARVKELLERIRGLDGDLKKLQGDAPQTPPAPGTGA